MCKKSCECIFKKNKLKGYITFFFKRITRAHLPMSWNVDARTIFIEHITHLVVLAQFSLTHFWLPDAAKAPHLNRLDHDGVRG